MTTRLWPHLCKYSSFVYGSPITLPQIVIPYFNILCALVRIMKGGNQVQWIYINIKEPFNSISNIKKWINSRVCLHWSDNVFNSVTNSWVFIIAWYLILYNTRYYKTITLTTHPQICNINNMRRHRTKKNTQINMAQYTQKWNKMMVLRPLLWTLFRLNWAKQTPGIMRRN